MSITVIDFFNSPNINMGFEKALVYYVKNHGQIVGLDKFAHDAGFNPEWVRRCAHSAEAKGLVKLTRLKNKVGRPYRVTLQEESHES